MHVEMIDGLAAIGTTVDDQPVSAGIDAGFPGDPVRCRRKQTHDALRICAQVGDRFYMRSRHDEDMYRGRWIDVPEGHDVWVFVDEFGRQRPFGNSAEKTLGHVVVLQVSGITVCVTR